MAKMSKRQAKKQNRKNNVPKMRVTKKDREEFKRLNRNVKAKERRVEKNYGVDLRGEVNTPSSVEDFQSRKEYNSWKDQAKSFTNRANLNYQFAQNENGVVATKKELHDINQMTKQAQNITDKRNEARANLPRVNEEGKVQGKVEDIMTRQATKQRFARVSDFDFNSIETRAQLELRKRTVEKRSSEDFYTNAEETLKENFVDMFGRATKGAEDSDYVVEELSKLPPDEFYNFYSVFEGLNINQYASEEDAYLGEDSIDNHVEQMKGYIDQFKTMMKDFQ